MKMNIMIYGPLQYFTDELNSWSRILTFHKEELRASVRQIGALMDHPEKSQEVEKTSGSLTDQLMVQEQQFDHILNQVVGQKHRLHRSGCDPGHPIDGPALQTQDSLRIKVKAAEQHFIRIRYTCSVHLATFLGEKSYSVQT